MSQWGAMGHYRLAVIGGDGIGLKDLTETRGIRTTKGSRIYEHHVPDEDALIARRLKGAGAIVVGKTNTPEAAFCGVVGFRTTPGLVPVYPRELAWDSLSVSGPMARTAADTALMLSVIAGPDDRAPLSYDVDTREFLRAVRAPSVKGWRVAWTPELPGVVPVDAEVARVAEGATRIFRSLGARVETACPDFSEVNGIVLATRGLSMVALHADKLPRWRDQMQKGLVRNIEQGLRLTPEAIGRGEKLRTALWHRVRVFMETHDLLILPSRSRTTPSGSS